MDIAMYANIPNWIVNLVEFIQPAPEGKHIPLSGISTNPPARRTRIYEVTIKRKKDTTDEYFGHYLCHRSRMEITVKDGELILSSMGEQQFRFDVADKAKIVQHFVQYSI